MAWTTYTDTGSVVSGTTSTTSGVFTWDELTTVSATNIYVLPQDYGRYQSNGIDIYFDAVKDDKCIHPRLYFKFIKSKLTKLQQKEMNERLIKLQKLVVQAENLGQTALYEELARKVAITIKEQEANVCGIEYVVHGDVINKYRNKVKGPTIGFCKLESYARPIPVNVKKRIEKCKELNLFDQYWVLYLEYKDKIDVGGKKKEEKIESKTNKEKIKEKDPILFGVQEYMPDKYYFIIDWIDEYCDLTLDKFVETIKRDDPEYDLDKIDDITPELLQRLVQESRDRHDRLKDTKRDNFKKLMEEEDASYAKKTKNYINTKVKEAQSTVKTNINKLKDKLKQR